jgi:hypothetical protein
MSAEFAFVDYRKDGHVVVEEVDEKTFNVTLKFFVSLVEEDNSVNTDDILEKWCSKWTSKNIADEFTYCYTVKDHCWVSPGVFRMTIQPDEDGTQEFLYDSFRYDCLEDTMYEGNPEDSFWIIPSLKRIYEEQNPTIQNV